MPGSQDTRRPFAKLVVHSIMKGVMAKHKTMHSVLVATQPQDRPQAVALAQTINKASGSNAVLVYTKCDHDFDPKRTEMLEGVGPDKCGIPAYALRRPAASVEENHDYSSDYESTKCNILTKLLRPVMEAQEGFESVPASAELLLQKFAKRIMASAKRIDLMHRWTGTPFVHYKEEWLTEEGRAKLEILKHALKSTWLGVRSYYQKEIRYEDAVIVIAAWDLSLSSDELSEIESHAEQAGELLTVVLIGFSTLTLESPLRACANAVMLSPVIQTRN